jgi:hypothetical protein
MSLQAITNWHGSHWTIAHNDINGLWDLNGGGIGILIGARYGIAASYNGVEYNKIDAYIAVPMQEYSTPGILLMSDARYTWPGGDVKGNVIGHNKVDFKGHWGVGCELTDLSDLTDDVTSNVSEFNDLEESTYPWAFNPTEVLYSNFFNKNKPQPEGMICALPGTMGPKPYGLGGTHETGFSHGGRRILGLGQNAPNPFEGRTTIRFELRKAGYARLDILDASGRLVRTLMEGELGTGTYSHEWDATRAASGVYFYNLSSGGHSLVGKMLVLK